MKVVFYLLLGVFILSCSKNDTGTSGQKQLLLKRDYMDGQLQSEYKYYENNRLKSTSYFKADETILAIIIYEYSGDTIFRSYFDDNSELVSSWKTVSNSESFKIKWYDDDNQLISYIVYINDFDPCGFSGVNNFDADNNLIQRNVYEYFDSNCSVKESEYNAENQLKYINESIMDGKNNCYKSTTLFNSPKNGNITEYVSRDPFALNIYTTYNSAFEYNSDNYPVSETRVYHYGLVVNYEYEYY